jgi:predicted nucleic acid-binding protein
MMRPYGIPPITNAAAWAVYDGLHSDRGVGWMDESPGNDVDRRCKAFAARDLASPKLRTDANLAALAVSGGHRLVTTDKAFTQFEGLDPTVLVPTKSRG